MAPKLFNKKDDLHTISLGINYFDAEGLKTRFRMTVIDKVKKARVIVSQFLKDSSPTAATAKTVWTGGGVSHSSNIKREAVQLPKFSGDKMLFLNILFGSKIGNLKFWNMRKNTEQVC